MRKVLQTTAFLSVTALSGAIWTVAACQTLAAEPDTAASAPIATADRAAVQAETDAQIEAYLNRPMEAAEPPPAAETGPRRMHGEVGASIGSGGYRSAYGVVNMPFGQANNLGVAVQSTRYPSRHGFGGGTSQSLALNLQINGSLFGSAPPDCMKRTGQRLPSDDKADAACAKLKAKDGETDTDTASR